MKIFRNRTVIGVLCILLALVICFGVTPLFSRSASEKAEIVRVTADIKEGDEITAETVQTVEVCSRSDNHQHPHTAPSQPCAPPARRASPRFD